MENLSKKYMKFLLVKLVNLRPIKRRILEENLDNY